MDDFGTIQCAYFGECEFHGDLNSLFFFFFLVLKLKKKPILFDTQSLEYIICTDV